MNWSNYSRFVGDIFGAPLAMEGLAAFFVESTFLGLWIFGWGRLPRGVHLACIWAVPASTALSAYFILAANSWMQHPVGYEMVDGRPQLTNIASVLFNNTALFALAHTLLAALITASMVVIAISAWHVRRGNETAVFGATLRGALPVLTVAALVTVIVGHFNGDLMVDQQPMKMAAADAVFDTEKGAGLSLFATGDFESNPEGLNRNVEIPNLLSWISTGYPRGEVQGINDINAEYRQKYGPGEYAPIVAVAYWSWRVMLGVGFLVFLLGALGWWFAHRGRLEGSRRYLRWMVPAAILPFLANSAGWVFTEMGRQPWVVFGMLKTDDAGSPSVSTAEVLITLIGFTLLYGVLAADRRAASSWSRPVTGRTPRARGRRASRTWRSRTEMDDVSFLQGLWFVLISILWLGYFVLEGFDFGVGMLIRAVGRTPNERRAVIHSIGPVWDGNEVWLHRGRRRDVRRVPGVVRDAVLGLLPRAVPDPRRADRPRGGIRVLGQAAGARVAVALGVGADRRQLRAGAAVGRRLGEHRRPACRSTGPASSPARCSTCSVRTPCSGA